MGFALEELGPEQCRQIAEGLFRVEKVYGDKLHGFCPVHGDQASASFVYHFGADWYKCQSCSAGGDLVKLWCQVHGLDSRGEGFKAFKHEFVGQESTRSGRSKRAPTPPSKKQDPSPPADVFVDEDDFAALPPLPPQRVTELRRLRGWTPRTIEILDLREFDDGRGNKKIAIPIRDDVGRLGNVRLYQPGADRFKVISWFDAACKQCGGTWKKVNKAKLCSGCGKPPADYGRTRLFPPPAQWQREGHLWLMEGEPDTIAALSVGLNACTQTAGCGTWRDEFSRVMAGRDVKIAYDADRAGWKGAHVAAESIAEHAKSVQILVWPKIMGEVA